LRLPSRALFLALTLTLTKIFALLDRHDLELDPSAVLQAARGRKMIYFTRRIFMRIKRQRGG